MTEVRRSLLAYAAAVVACAVLLAVVFEFWRLDPHVPLSYTRDSVCTQLWAKGVVENGWFLENPRLGAPFGMEMHDFPLADGLFFGLERALSLATHDPVLLVNLYYLGTYVLTTLAALLVLRRLGVPRGPGVVCALLYAFLPYHLLRAEEHLFLASYFLVPPAILVSLWVYRDGPLFFREDESGRARLKWRDPKALTALGVAALLGSGGVYYAAFACYLLLVAGACASAARRTALPLASAAILVAVVAAGVAANVAPALAHARAHGPNPAVARREPGHTEFFALKIAQLLLPVTGHRIGPLARLRAEYDGPNLDLIHETGSSTLGVVGGLGFLALIGALFLRRKADAPRPFEGLAALNLAALLLATTGGFGAIVGYVVSPLIRCYTRISVFIAFLALAAVGLGLGRLVWAARPGWPRVLVNVALVAVLALGIADQTNPSLRPDYEGIAARFADEAEFVGRIEAALPAGSMVFQLPLVEFPEGSAPGRMGNYDPARAYLHSKSLAWSFGAMKGRYGDAWQKQAADRPAAEMLRAIAPAGFSGVWVDRLGYDDRGAAIEAKLAEASGAAAIASRDGRYAFFDLSAYVAALRTDLGPDRWAAARAEALSPMLVTWHGGFYGLEQRDDLTWRWCSGEGEVRIKNPTDRPRRVEVTMGLATLDPAPATIAIEGPDGEVEYPAGASVSRALAVPPGGAVLRFRSDAKRVAPAGDYRTLAFRVERLRVAEAGGSGVASAAGAAPR